MNMNHDIIRLIQGWPCCSLSTVKITVLPERERQFFGSFMPNAVTAIALLHHVVTEEEWTWYATGGGGRRCKSDDHLRALCEKAKSKLTAGRHAAKLVEYPGKSGLQFRFVAQAAGLGVVGANAFLFHPTWGSWVHLRVMATSADLDIRHQFSGNELCDQCNLCIPECPSEAISEGSFDGLRCRSHLETRGHYAPYGPSGQYGTCRTCISVCPKGRQTVPPGNAFQDVHTADATKPLGRKM
jgi:epoxyqueuosine reductase QueG